MVDREDIDALLIGSLYGELSSADEARLQAHLASGNPQAQADRRALEDLTHARSQVRESRLLAHQVEPPQSVTALLMQEAARRAPKQVTESEGWFARFVNSFVRHPAMAAAATLVLVVGVAGSLYLRNGNQFAEQTKDSSVAYRTDNTAASADQQAAPSITAATPPGTGMAAGSAMLAQPNADFGTGSYGYKDGSDPNVADKGAATRGDVAGNERDPGVVVGLEEAEGRAQANRPAGIVVTTPDPQPKDLDEVDSKSKERKKTETAAPRRTVEKTAIAQEDDAYADAESPDIAREETTRDERTGAAGGAVAPRNPAPAVKSDVAKKPAPPAKPMSPATTTPQPQPAPPPAQVATNNGQGQTADPELAWAQTQHKRVLAEVRANHCTNAATIANQIATRNPDYYSENVESDRDVKNCMAYVTAQREKAEAERQKVAKKQRAEAAKPTKKKAAPATESKPTSTSTDSK